MTIAVIYTRGKHEALISLETFQATEAIAASQAGAHCLKIFPASNLGADGIKALRAVLPSKTHLCAVGGVGNHDFEHYLDAGAQSFGVGSSLYAPGLKPEEVYEKAKAAADAFRAC